MARSDLVDYQFEGINELRRELKATGGQWPKELAKTHRVLAREVTGEAQKFARGYGGVTGHFAGKITGSGSPNHAAIGVRSPGAAGIWGTKAHTGWFRRPQFDNSPKGNQPQWVGSSWSAGGDGGPYGINDAIRHDMPKIVDRYGELIDALTERAFPTK